jgi:hypothetical protein
VRRAVEVLVQALDRADVAHNRQLLAGVAPAQLYEAGLTVMMRLVILLCAEQRRLLLLGDEIYDQHYAVTTLRARLAKEQRDLTDEVLERRHDAWSRLLAVCRGVYGGIEHATLRLPPLGGSLFDPDRFPFLEGRAAGTSWRDTPANPLPIDNRTVLMLLTALQVLEQSGGAQMLSYEALDVEQIGHVYEGLLERTVKRVPEVTVGLIGSAKAINPVAALHELEELAASGTEQLVTFLEEKTGRSAKALHHALEKPVDDALAHRIAIACGSEQSLAPRLRPFAHLLREDTWQRLLVYPKDSFIVTMGAGRRETGTHYTPKALTEPIVQHTLEPLVYVGPAEGQPREEWRLKTPADILALKVCDLAMGSGAFLVQSCRWLAERLVEAWEAAEKAGRAISIEGVVLDRRGAAELLPRDKAERVLIARRLIASRCLYGVDINPMAVDLAKLSLWLVTMMKGRPFNFLDHALKCGDSLLGVSSLQQIENFSLRPGERQATFATANLFRHVKEASAKRRALEDLPSNDYTQIETKNRLHAEAEATTATVKALADALIAFELRGLDGGAYEEQRADEAERLQLLLTRDAEASFNPQSPTIKQLSVYAREQLRGRRIFNWAVEFPEVFAHGGFNSFVGNPPFMGGLKIYTEFGREYREFLVRELAQGTRGIRGTADLCAYFLLRVCQLIRNPGFVGMLATNTIAQGDTRSAGLDQIANAGIVIYGAIPSAKWPGISANLEISYLWLCKAKWGGTILLNEQNVSGITPSLTQGEVGSQDVFRLKKNSSRGFQGSILLGTGFILSTEEALRLIKNDPDNKDVLFPFLNGDDVTSRPDQSPSRWAIQFDERNEHEARRYVEVWKIVEARVKPERSTKDAKKYPRMVHEWWKHWSNRQELYPTIASLPKTLVIPLVAKYLFVAWQPSTFVYSQTLGVIAACHDEEFALYQSVFHEEWARARGSTLETRMRYTPTNCFETFPVPTNISSLSKVGFTVESRRRALCKAMTIGLTDLYNRFHDRGEKSEDIAQLRALHAEMDQAVAAAYGWRDLDLGHGFHPTKHGERYTISETARRTVLDRLLALNNQRYAEEVAAGLHDKKRSAKSRRRSPGDTSELELL